MKSNDEPAAFPVAMITDVTETAEVTPAVAGENGDSATCCKTPAHPLLTHTATRPEDKGHPERKRRASNDSVDVRLVSLTPMSNTSRLLRTV